MKKELTIKDLYASDDFVEGLKAGRKMSPKLINEIIKEKKEPIELDKHTWFYIEKKNIILVHEIYIDNKYIRTDQIKISKKLLLN